MRVDTWLLTSDQIFSGLFTLGRVNQINAQLSPIPFRGWRSHDYSWSSPSAKQPT